MNRKTLVAFILSVAVFICDGAGISAYATESGKTVPTTSDKPVQTEKTTSQNVQAVKSLTNEELVEYYKDSVFVGDSLMLGFRNYCMKQDKDSFLHSMQFFATGNYSAFNAMKPVTADNVHPLYKGKKYHIWDAVSMMEGKKVFLLLGMNDISILGLEGSRDTYKELIDTILETCPDAEIHILSTTHTLKGQGKGKLKNENLEAYNMLLQEMAEENEWNYIDVSTPLTDEDGNLLPEYCSDGFLHLMPSAYEVWTEIFSDYAAKQVAQAEEAKKAEQETGKNENNRG